MKNFIVKNKSFEPTREQLNNLSERFVSEPELETGINNVLSFSERLFKIFKNVDVELVTPRIYRNDLDAIAVRWKKGEKVVEFVFKKESQYYLKACGTEISTQMETNDFVFNDITDKEIMTVMSLCFIALEDKKS